MKTTSNETLQKNGNRKISNYVPSALSLPQRDEMLSHLLNFTFEHSEDISVMSYSVARYLLERFAPVIGASLANDAMRIIDETMYKDAVSQSDDFSHCAPYGWHCRGERESMQVLMEYLDEVIRIAGRNDLSVAYNVVRERWGASKESNIPQDP